MKIKDLITKLQSFDPDLDVCLNGYEGGVYEMKDVRLTEVALNVNEEWYYGPHEECVEGFEHYPAYKHAQMVRLY